MIVICIYNSSFRSCVKWTISSFAGWKTIDYRCDDGKTIGELRDDIGVIRCVLSPF